ncbi:GNAT family N-acetyltransferase [Acinetobacter sp. Marseille-Q1623]|uniref:GNAT family N-acetyltransferase n=1 Tax=Acinetobacter sp. Marseille-Q1623 TaxID=2697501 RepID=UPI00157AF240|nr:GNAT family N-acetyltransferase [Acinetobacter sp. Marseille-Q1623]
MNIEICEAEIIDAQYILELQKVAYQSEAKLYQDWTIPPLTQTLLELEAEFTSHVILVAILEQEIIGSVRAYVDQETTYIGRLIVHPKFQKMGIGSRLLSTIEKLTNCKRYELYTGHKSIDNLKLYKKLGYQIFKSQRIHNDLEFIYLHKHA